jgi:hypothetical protein
VSGPRILVCGSRDWTDGDAIADRLADFATDNPTIIHGGARGADTMAENIASLYGYKIERFPAEWARHGKRAGFMRNLAMLDTKPDLVLAFQSNGSKGTQHTIDEARKRGIRVEVEIECDATPDPPADPKGETE